MKCNVLLNIRKLVVQREKFLLNIENLDICTNECIALIGHNGAGKTTLLLALAGFLKTTQFDVLFDGFPLNMQQLSKHRKHIGMIFQEPLLFNATVRENIELGLKFHKIPTKQRNRKIMECAEMLKIEHLLSRHTSTLSAGEARRVSLARSLVIKPKLLLMDEPFSSLDNLTRDSIIDDLLEILQNTHCSIIFSSHNRDEVLRMADKIVVLHNGFATQQGIPTDIINNPADEFTAAFMGIETILTGKVVNVFQGGFYVEVADKIIEVSGIAQKGEIVTIGILPQNVVISKEKKYSNSMRNAFKGKVFGINHTSTHVRISIDCGFKLIAFITPHSLKKLNLSEGNSVIASFKATSVHIIKKLKL